MPKVRDGVWVLERLRGIRSRAGVLEDLWSDEMVPDTSLVSYLRLIKSDALALLDALAHVKDIRR